MIAPQTSMEFSAASPAHLQTRPSNPVLTYIEKPLVITMDLAVAWLCFVTTNSWAKVWTDDGSRLGAIAFAAIVTIVILRFWSLGHYSRRKPFWDETWETVQTTSVGMLGNCSVVLLGALEFSRTGLLGSWLLFPFLLTVARVLLRRTLLSTGGWSRPTVIVGAGPNARFAAQALASESLMGCQLVAFMDPDYNASTPATITISGREIPVIGIESTPDKQLLAMGRPQVVLALEDASSSESRDLIEILSRDNRGIYLVPPLRGLPLYGTDIYHFFSHEVLLLQARNNLARRAPQVIKRIFDVVVASLALVILSPLLLFIAWRIRGTGGSVVYGHRRVGKRGKSFPCYKFRTMVPNAGQVLQELLANDPAALLEWKRDFKLRNDPRITPIGAILRKTSLDELPQLWNVIKGDMSLVGPRPVVTEELELYGKSRPYYLEARPGITGLWQVSGRNEVDYSQRVYLDAWYVKNWSLWYDMVILLKTVKVVLSRRGAY